MHLNQAVLLLSLVIVPEVGTGKYMSLLTRDQAEQNWNEADPDAQFEVLLQVFECYKDISTECGLNQTVHQGWRIGDPHKKKGKPDRHDYKINTVDGREELPGRRWRSLYRWLVSQ